MPPMLDQSRSEGFQTPPHTKGHRGHENQGRVSNVQIAYLKDHAGADPLGVVFKAFKITS